MSDRMRTAAVAGAAAACLAAAVGLQAARERWYPAAERAAESVLYVRSGAAMSRLALSYDALVADVYWIRAVQYFGRTRLSKEPGKDYNLLYPLLDLTTTLDPHFNIAYRFGAVFLAEGYPNGPGQPGKAVALLEKGFAANPGRWQYLQDIGFVYYWWLQDYAAAASWFKRASDVPGAPEWLAPLAAVTLTKGGDRAGSRFLWEQIRQSAEHDYVRKVAEHRLQQLRVMDELDRLNAMVARIRQDTGAAVTSFAPLVTRGWLRRAPPADPADVPYVFDPRTGLVTASSRSPYFPLPVESPAPGPRP